MPSVAARAAAGNNDVQGGQARVVVTDHSLTFIKEHHDRQRQWTGPGTTDKDYNIVWFTEVCLSNALRLETYISDAERAGDSELAEFFRKAQADSRKGGVQGKALLKSRLDR